MKRISAHYQSSKAGEMTLKRSRQSTAKRDLKKADKKLQKAVAKAFRLMIRQVRDE